MSKGSDLLFVKTRKPAIAEKIKNAVKLKNSGRLNHGVGKLLSILKGTSGRAESCNSVSPDSDKRMGKNLKAPGRGGNLRRPKPADNKLLPWSHTSDRHGLSLLKKDRILH